MALDDYKLKRERKKIFDLKNNNPAFSKHYLAIN